MTFEPYDYVKAAPPRSATPLDGTYLRVVSIDDAGGPEHAIPMHCLRCVPYSVDAGVQTLTFSSNLGDDTQLREVLASEILRDRGVPAARAAFYRVYVDAGEGSEYWGLYTMVEDPADGAMLEAQFGSNEGNLYKPEGPGANWTAFDPEGFDKKTNERAADFSDVERAIRALHAPRDTPQAWRAALEAQFDVDQFLRWLAVNTVIENWDAYGVMAHNYYLYGDPARRGQLRWIPAGLRVRMRVQEHAPQAPGVSIAPPNPNDHVTAIA